MGWLVLISSHSGMPPHKLAASSAKLVMQPFQSNQQRISLRIHPI